MEGRHGRAAHDRAEALLFAHLTDEQRREYQASRTITVVKEGIIWRTALGYAAVGLGVVSLALVGRRIPSLEALTVVAALVLIASIALFLVWIPPLAVACTRRRVWIVGAGRRPVLVLGARRIQFCVRIDGDVPDADRVLAYKNVLEGDERYFLRKANALV